jgi:hypothetical protein
MKLYQLAYACRLYQGGYEVAYDEMCRGLDLGLCGTSSLGRPSRDLSRDALI